MQLVQTYQSLQNFMFDSHSYVYRTDAGPLFYIERK